MTVNRELQKRLERVRDARVVILGVGNLLKGDDGAGPLVCEALRHKVAAQVINAGTVPENYIRPIVEASPQFLLVVDAIDFGGQPGAISVFRPGQINEWTFSTHALSLRLFLDVLAREIEFEALLIGVQPVCIQLGRPVSLPVQESIRDVADAIAALFPVVGRAIERSPDTVAK